MISIYVVVLFMLLLNAWVWFFPSAFIGYLQRGKGAKVESVFPSLQRVWEHVESPTYIWGPRIAFGIGLIAVLLLWWLVLE